MLNELVSNKILIVEDSILNARITADTLNMYGYRTEVVRTGEEAVEQVCSGQRPDLVLMDIELGNGMSGIDAALKIHIRCNIPIIFLTANACKRITEQIKSVTAYGYVTKSTNPYVLLSAVDMALTRWRAEQGLELYRCIVEESLNEIYVFHRDTLKFIAVNRIARDNLGYTMEELHKMTPLDIKPEMERRSFKGLLAPLVGGEQEGAMFHTVQRRKDGSLYPVEVHLQLLKAQGEEAYLALIINLTERRAMEQELREREGVLSAITDSVHDAIIMIDKRGRVVFWNPATEQLLGYAPAEILGQDLHQLFLLNRELRQKHEQAFRQFQATGQGSLMGKNTELKCRRKDGQEIYVEVSLSAVRIKDDWHAVGILRDISERKKMEDQLYRLSITDPLTEVYNRRYFSNKLNEEIERTRRTGRTFSLVMLDLDHFKSVNDRFGHAVGDSVLKTIASAIRSRIRTTDILARWGGEEFTILLPETQENKAACLAEELRTNIGSLVIPEVGQVTASFGITEYVPSDTVDTIILRADRMTYEAKSFGRNCIRCSGQGERTSNS